MIKPYELKLTHRPSGECYIFCMPLYAPKINLDTLPADKFLEFIRPRERRKLAQLMGPDWKQNVIEITMEATTEKDITIEAFEQLQSLASKAGSMAQLTLDRPDGWKWRISVLPPGYVEDDK